jgi:predicted kinase
MAMNGMRSFNEFIIEGMFDPSIFKSIFLAGGPGSGKSYVAGKATGGLGMKVVNSDDIYELKLKTSGLGMDFTKFDDKDFERSQVIRDRAKKLTKMRMKQWVDGRLGMIIDGTGKEFDRIKSASEGLRGLGYDTLMIFVNTSLEVALERNKMRPRTLPDNIVKASWEDVQKNLGKFQGYFGNENFIIVDNNDASEDVFRKVFVKIRSIVQEPLQNHIAKKWIDKEKRLKMREEFQLNEFDTPQIYCDMDGVVADFHVFTGKHLGTKFKDKFWKDLPKDTFAKLPLMPDAKKLWNFIGKYNPIMLTAIPRESRGDISKQAASDKTKWMKNHFNLKQSDMRAVSRQDKQQFAKDGRDGRPNVLIDDHVGNIKEFRAKGGIGIHHTSATDTINQLKDLGFK